MKALHLNISLSDWITTFFAIHKFFITIHNFLCLEISIYLRHWNQNKQKCIPVCSYHNSTPLIMFH